MSLLLATFMDVFAQTAGAAVNQERGRVHYGLHDDGPVRLMPFEVSDDEIAERRSELVSLRRGWLQDEQRDVMTAAFVCPV